MSSIHASSRLAPAVAALLGALAASGGAVPALGGSSTRAEPARDAPAPRAHHQLVRHAAEGRVYLIGGGTPGDEGHRTYDDVWVWTDGAWRPAGRLPFPRAGHDVVYSPDRSSLLMFGGTDGGSLRADSSLWERADGAWSAVAAAPEAAVGEPGVCYDRVRQRLVLYGGAKPDGVYASATWEWDGDRLRRISARGGPGARLGHVLFWDPVGERCLLFGGRDASGEIHGDTWTWDGSGWRALDVDGPGARWIHTATADPERRRAVVFGGQDPGGELLGDTWSWDGGAWRRLARSGPSPRMMGRMAPADEGVLLFGGRGASRPDAATAYADRADTWRLRVGRWERVAGTGGSNEVRPLEPSAP